MGGFGFGLGLGFDFGFRFGFDFGSVSVEVSVEVAVAEVSVRDQAVGVWDRNLGFRPSSFGFGCISSFRMRDSWLPRCYR